MNLRCTAAALAAVGLLFATPFAAAPVPRASMIPAPVLSLPGTVDSNSPVMWDLEDGQQRMFVLTSHSGTPSVASGLSVEGLGAASPVNLVPHPGHGVWMEAVVSDDVETWYGYYHNEWPASRCDRDDRFVRASARRVPPIAAAPGKTSAS